jgi:hypothetical protein
MGFENQKIIQVLDDKWLKLSSNQAIALGEAVDYLILSRSPTQTHSQNLINAAWKHHYIKLNSGLNNIPKHLKEHGLLLR